MLRGVHDESYIAVAVYLRSLACKQAAPHPKQAHGTTSATLASRLVNSEPQSRKPNNDH